METTQPVYIDQYGTHRFKQNHAVWFIAENKLNDVAMWNYDPDMNIHLDDFRQFNQLIGYSLGGYSDLQVCYQSGKMTFEDDNDWDHNYVDYIYSLDIHESEPEYHPHQLERENGFYKPNKVVQYLVEKFGYDIEDILTNNDLPLDCRRHFAELVGLSISEVKRRFGE